MRAIEESVITPSFDLGQNETAIYCNYGSKCQKWTRDEGWPNDRLIFSQYKQITQNPCGICRYKLTKLNEK